MSLVRRNYTVDSDASSGSIIHELLLLLSVDAKKALSGFSSSTGGPTGTGYMPYLDFKKSPMFSNCYNYGPPQMPPHLPFIPFGYHGMMNLAVAGSQLAALQRRGDELQRFTMAGVRPHATDSGTPSQRYTVL